MATRSLILKRNDDGVFTGVYCHWDGYPDGVGRRLADNYGDITKIDALIDLGDLSMLGPELKDTVAFCRDRGDDMAPPFVFSSLDEVKGYLDESSMEYAHVFTDGKWTTYGADGNVYAY